METPSVKLARFGSALAVAAAICVAGLGAPGVADDGADMPDLATARTQLDEMWRRALDMPEDDPMFWAAAWGVVIESEVVLERRRQIETPDPDARVHSPAEIAEGVFARWSAARPGSPGPDIFRALQIQDPAGRELAMTDLLDRHPDSELVLSFAARACEQNAHAGRANELLEAFLVRHPGSGAAHRLLAFLHQHSENRTRLAEVLVRWADAAPVDGSLVSWWLDSVLVQQDPERTARLLERFLGSEARDASALQACLTLARGRGHLERWSRPGRECVARIAASPEGPDGTAERARVALAELAGAERDWDSVLAALESVPADRRVAATLEVANATAVPDDCSVRIALLDLVAEQVSTRPDLVSAIAGALAPCARRLPAQAAYLELLTTVSAESLPAALNGWVMRVDGNLRGEMPAGAAAVLEQRLSAGEGSAAVFSTLDTVYEMTGSTQTRTALLARWERSGVSGFGSEQAVALARGLIEAGDRGGAVRVLEEQVQRDTEGDAAEVLAAILVGEGDLPRARRLADILIDRRGSSAERAGHKLAARLAALEGDFETADSEYREALRGEVVDPVIASEWLGMSSGRAGADPSGLALRICRETSLGRGQDPRACAVDLLVGAGLGDAAGRLVADLGEVLPSELPALRELAATAARTGDEALAERALRKVVQLDPRSPEAWVALAHHLERAAAPDAAEAVLAEARAAIGRPPADLLRAVGRVCLASGRAARAIELLGEARAMLPPGSDPAWINDELRRAYAAFGRERP